jgi:hypothetical protein
MGEHDFAIKVVCQSRMGTRVEHNIPPIPIINANMNVVTSANVWQNNELKFKQS